MSKAIKIPLIVILILSCLVDAFWIAIYFVAPDKTTLNIYNVGQLSGTEDKNGNKKPIIEVNSFNDCFEVKFNYYRDTNSNKTYSTGIQFMTKTPYTLDDLNLNSAEIRKFISDRKINDFYQEYLDMVNNGEIFDNIFEKKIGDSAFWLGRTNNYYKVISNVKSYCYSSDENVSFKATNSLVDNDGFYISIGEDRYLMKIKPCYFVLEEHNGFNNWTNYLKLDINYFLQKLYASVISIDTFTNGYITFEFGDLFDYYKETSPGVFERDKEYDNSKIIELTKNYYNIKVNIHNTNIQRAEQSLFGQVGFNSNYYVGDIVTSNYYTGTSPYVLREWDFNIIHMDEYGDRSYYFKFSLRNDIYQKIKKSKKTSCIVLLNLDELETANIYYGGLIIDSFNDITVSHVYNVTVVNDIYSIKSEVKL